MGIYVDWARAQPVSDKRSQLVHAWCLHSLILHIDSHFHAQTLPLRDTHAAPTEINGQAPKGRISAVGKLADLHKGISEDQVIFLCYEEFQLATSSTFTAASVQQQGDGISAKNPLHFHSSFHLRTKWHLMY